MKQSQSLKVQNHLITNKSITSIEAIKKYGATRLSSIIYRLRYVKNWKIKSKIEYSVNRYGNSCRYAKYVLVKKGE